MRLSRLIPSLIAVFAVVACATHAPSPGDALSGASGAPAATPGLDWFMNRDGSEASLAYGVANSDEVKLHLLCQAGTGALEVTASSEKPGREIHLESGGNTERYAAISEPAVVHEGELLTAHAATKDPVFQRFRRLGWIANWADGEREVYVAHPTAKAGIERFFAVCG